MGEFFKSFLQQFSLEIYSLTFAKENDLVAYMLQQPLLPRMIAAIISALVLGVAIFFIYRWTYDGVMYSKNFNISLVVMAIVATMLILTVSSNLVMTIGSLAALTIVRFRSALKDPLDIVFMFWAVSVGIICGLGLYYIALLDVVFVAIFVVIFKKFYKAREPFMLVIMAKPEAEEAIYEAVKSVAKRFNVKSKALNKTTLELNIEVKATEATSHLVNIVSELEGVDSAVMVTFNGEYAG